MRLWYADLDRHHTNTNTNAHTYAYGHTHSHCNSYPNFDTDGHADASVD